MKGVLYKNKITIKVNDNDAPYRLTELKNVIFKFLNLDPIDETRWERERTKFFKEVKEIDYKNWFFNLCHHILIL